MNAIARFMNDENGGTAIEYALVASLVSISAVLAMDQLRNQITALFTTVETAMTR